MSVYRHVATLPAEPQFPAYLSVLVECADGVAYVTQASGEDHGGPDVIELSPTQARDLAKTLMRAFPEPEPE